ncbi:hypothetical protein [Polyangium sp. 15x6]|uniref:hypothetical protein n=1 Tax=Polyangium sp. 15x6 TaxID=3042687 RepID=UPI00249B78C8|nr:hypothetical protein [Polyangium sp. 15x6]MDI3288879.1 hypothetical protein [Polyangium sp. 15x6]
MRHSIDELLAVVYHHHPRGLSVDDPGYASSEDLARLSEARRQAGRNAEPWRAMLRRLREQFPEITVQNRSLDLPAGGAGDASYSGALHLPPSEGEHVHTLGFLVSFLVPYYVVYSSRLVDIPEQEGTSPPPCLRFHFEHDTSIVLPPDPSLPDGGLDTGQQEPRRRDIIAFDFTSAEQPYAASIAREIESTFGHERMPPNIGATIVPDVSTGLRRFGEATLYDCLFAEHW